jgi:hypothetical protein
MIHDRQMLKTANTELLNLGIGQVSYMRKLKENEIADLPAEADGANAWGLFSASGEPLAICDSEQSAWNYAMDQELITVRLH